METQGTLWLGVASGIISFIIADALIFSTLRIWANKKSLFLGKLLSCGFCVGFYVAGILEMFYQYDLFDTILFLDLILTWFVIAFFSGITWLVLCILFRWANK